MPEILHRCVEEVMGKGHDEQSAYAICRTSLGLQADGSQDAAAPDVPDSEMRVRVLSELTKRDLGNYPVIKKRVQICEAVGDYVNGDQEGALTMSRFKRLVDNFTKYPRQVPVYLVVGDPNPEHPENLDDRLADGWIEGLSIEGRYLMGDLRANGPAAVAIVRDQVRGASIGTAHGQAYDGTPIGEYLEHVVLTNNPFVKGMNIAARHAKGGERVACYFTALTKEAPVADDKKKDQTAPKTDDTPDAGVNFQERAKALEGIVKEKDETIKELTASRDNLLKEVETFKANPQLAEAVTRMKSMERQLRAEKVRRVIVAMCNDGQVVRETVKWAFGDSDETVLAGFESGDFKGKMELLEFARATYPKSPMRRTFASGDPGDEGTGLTAEEKEQAKAHGKDPEVLAKTKGASNFTDYKRRKAAKG